jgi:putative transposase
LGILVSALYFTILRHNSTYKSHYASPFGLEEDHFFNLFHHYTSPMQPPSLSIRHLTSIHLDRAKMKLAYVLLERDLFQKYGPTATHHLTDDDRRQLARLGHDLGWIRLSQIAVIATIRTFRRWYRALVGKSMPKSAGGKTGTSAEFELIVVRLALENDWSGDAWGAKRIVGEMMKLGITIAKSTVSAILRRHGIPPAPKRGRVREGDQIIVHDPITTSAIDFAKVAIIDRGSICVMSILIAIHLGSREIEIVNVAHDPNGDITLQSARNLTMDGIGFFNRLGITTVVMDRDPLFTQAFRNLLMTSGCSPHRITAYSPWENGYAERFIRSLKESLLRKVIFTSESALRMALTDFQQYFNEERPHQGIGNRTVKNYEATPPSIGTVIRIPRVGGLINHYERVAG